MFNRRPDIWLPDYFRGAPGRASAKRRRDRQLTHIVFLVCDHFEPRHGIGRPEQAFERVETWHREYASLQSRCREAFGTVPVHSFFYPPHHGMEHLSRLSEMVFDGLGEVELHYHHQGDTEASLRRALQESIAEYHHWGLLLESGDAPRPNFGFIHGDWALNNSCAGKYCGVNDELTILRDLGCWADLTMPSGNICQTRKINSIYYAASSPERPKGHDRGTDARVGVCDPQGMLMMQGPLAINWRAPDHPRIENASLTTRNWGRPDRIRKWLDCNIHVQGRPEWLFVKLHTHGAIERDFDGLFGERAFAMHKELNEQYNDGRRYRLHYVTARQAYNIAKAAEHGKDGDPSAWLDYLIKPQAHSFYALNARHRLVACTSRRLEIADVESGPGTRLRTRVGCLRGVTGALAEIAVDASAESVRIRPATEDAVMLDLVPGARIENLEGASVQPVDGSEGGKFRLLVRDGHCHFALRSDRVVEAAAGAG